LVDVGLTGSEGLSIRLAATVAASRALRLWQTGVDLLSERLSHQISLHAQTSARACIGCHKKNPAIRVARRKDHAFRDAEAHFSRF
jgi:hypothetical protein